MILRKRIICLTFLMNLVLMGVIAQNTEKFYDFKWKECPLNEARFYRLIAKTDSGYFVTDYFIK